MASERLPAVLDETDEGVDARSDDLIKAVAMDIGKEVVAYIQVQYPQAVAATSSTFALSLRNSIYNEIIAALRVGDPNEIVARLEKRRKFRREWLAMWRKNRS